MNTAPVKVSINLDDIHNILRAAMECAEDLECELRDRYRYRMEHASEKRKFEQEMVTVERLKDCVVSIATQLPYVNEDI